MPLELAELAGGLPVAASLAMAGGISALREGRRRTSLNEAVHELRRPLQVLALSSSSGSPGATRAVESSLQMAAAAVDRLDLEINGGPAREAVGPVRFRDPVEAGVERWRLRASLQDRRLSFRWRAGEPCVSGVAVELAQAVDNLISNALDHGSGEVAVEVRRVGGAVRLVVLNRRCERPAGSGCKERIGARIAGRRRHGHGLRVVRRAAARGGGGFRLRRRGEAVEAVLELPLCGGPG